MIPQSPGQSLGMRVVGFEHHKTNGVIQSKLVSKALELAAEAEMKDWFVTADKTPINVKILELLGCRL